MTIIFPSHIHQRNQLRVKAVLKEFSNAENIIEYPPYNIDRSKRHIKIDDMEIELTNKEYEMLEYFWKH